MFENLTERLSKTLRHITGSAKLTENNISDTLKEVRNALLDADVALAVVTTFVEQIKIKALGQEVAAQLTPAQFLVKLVNDELTQLMGTTNSELVLKGQAPVVVLMAGLQGSGKTTTVAKLAKHLQDRQQKRVMVASCDVYRPAAINQLAAVAAQVGAVFFPSTPEDKPVNIAQSAVAAALRQNCDVVIIDTAGRLHIDAEMMAEIKAIHAAIKPLETLFVVDSMTGQDAANSAQAFNAALPLTGVILTKIDGDARGGAALSIRHITGKPIKFLGVGEKLDALEPFYPDRIASQILGMGDVLSLIEELERKIDKDKAEKFAKKVARGKGFDLDDLREQLQQVASMGGIASVMGKLPGMAAMSKGLTGKLGHDKQMSQSVVIINSMTKKERKHPLIIKGGRVKRIAQGSGTKAQDVTRLLKQHEQMQRMMKKVNSKGGMLQMMKSLEGRLPPGMSGFMG